MAPRWKQGTYPAAVLAAAVALAAACSNGSGGSGGGRTAVVIKGLDNPFFQAMRQGIEAQAKAQRTSVTVQAAASITDTTGQADKLNALALQNYGCYLVNPISGSNLVQALARVARARKPIVNIDSPVDAPAAKKAHVKIATYIGTDNNQAGQMAGQEMLKVIPAGSSVARIGGIAGDVTSQARLDGFARAAGAKLRIVQTVAADWDRQKALTAAQNVMRGRPGVKGFFVANDDMALGVARAIADAGKTGKIAVISVDGIQDALKAIGAGTLTATVSQYPYTIGAMGMEACKAAAGKTLPADVKAPVLLVTKANAGQALAHFPKPFQSYPDPFASQAG